MPRPIDMNALLRRGGEMTAAEEKQLTEEFLEAQLGDLSAAITSRSLDQPVKVIPLIGEPPAAVRGYFTQQKFITGKTPREMEAMLGIYGKLSPGAYILEFKSPLRQGDYECKAYTYLPDGKPYKPDPNEKVFLPGKGATQWRLKREVQASLIATVLPGEQYLIKPTRYSYK